MPKSEGVAVELGHLVVLDRHRADGVARIALEDRAVPVGVPMVILFLLFRKIPAVGVIGLVPNRPEVVGFLTGFLFLGDGATERKTQNEGTGIDHSVENKTLHSVDALNLPIAHP